MWYDRSVKARRDREKFRSLIASPASGSFVMPANLNLYASSDSGLSEGVAITASGKDIYTKSTTANEQYCLGWFEHDVEIQVKSGVTLSVDMGASNYQVIARG